MKPLNNGFAAGVDDAASAFLIGVHPSIEKGNGAPPAGLAKKSNGAVLDGGGGGGGGGKGPPDRVVEKSKAADGAPPEVFIWNE